MNKKDKTPFGKFLKGISILKNHSQKPLDKKNPDDLKNRKLNAEDGGFFKNIKRRKVLMGDYS